MEVALPLWLDYIEKHIGFILPKYQHQWLNNAINNTAIKHGLTCQALYEQVAKNDGLRQSLFDGVLISESRFFRDVGALSFVAQQYEAHLTTNRYEPFFVLSVGCATGQEVWSLAMVLEETYWRVRGSHVLIPANYQVLGIDVSKGALQTAKLAFYGDTSLSQIPDEYHRYVEAATHENEVGWQPITAIQRRTHFAWSNIFLPNGLNDTLRLSGLTYTKPHLIFCQNVLIYFRRFDQRDILGRMAEILKDDGHLILSAIDGTVWKHAQMVHLHHESANIWQKLTTQNTLTR